MIIQGNRWINIQAKEPGYWTVAARLHHFSYKNKIKITMPVCHSGIVFLQIETAAVFPLDNHGSWGSDTIHYIQQFPSCNHGNSSKSMDNNSRDGGGVIARSRTMSPAISSIVRSVAILCQSETSPTSKAISILFLFFKRHVWTAVVSVASIKPWDQYLLHNDWAVNNESD